MPTTVHSLHPDLLVLLPLHSTCWPAWTFPSLDCLMNYPVHGHGSLLKAATPPLTPALTPAVPLWQLFMHMSVLRLLARLVSPGLRILHSCHSPRSSSTAKFPLAGQAVPGSAGLRAECGIVSVGRRGQYNVRGGHTCEGQF